MTTTVLVWLLRCTTPSLTQYVFLTPSQCYETLARWVHNRDVVTEVSYRDRCLASVTSCTACVATRR
jgi:hypothetical protein